MLAWFASLLVGGDDNGSKTKAAKEEAHEELDMDGLIRDGLHAIHIAASIGDAKKLTDELKQGTDPNLLSREQGLCWTAMHYAAFYLSGSEAVDAQIVRELVKCGADIDAPDVGGETPLHKACKRGHARMVQALIDCKATIGVKSKRTMTPRQVASEHGHSDIAALLLALEAPLADARPQPRASDDTASSRRTSTSTLSPSDVPKQKTE